MMDQWPTDIEDPPLRDNQSDPEDKDGGHHSDDLLEDQIGSQITIYGVDLLYMDIRYLYANLKRCENI